MQVLNHHIYEYRKGLRNLVLHTLPADLIPEACIKLEKLSIEYLVQELNGRKANIFFGNSSCVEIIRHFGPKKLNEFSDEEDFILGIMLGYGRLEQCKRYLKRNRQGESACA